MRAVVQQRYGPPERLEVREVAVPSPGDRQVLVRVKAASVHADVWHVVHGLPYVIRPIAGGLRRPGTTVPGIDLAGTVEAVGAKATRFRTGDEVFGETVGIQWRNGGAFAEHAVVDEDRLEPKPADLSPVEAAAVPTTGMIAMQVLGDGGGVRPGDRVLVNGAAGGVGTFAVQVAAAQGATVTAVDSAPKLAMLERIGADRVVDHAAQDFTRLGERWDLIVDVATNRSIADYRRALTPDGAFVVVGHHHYDDRSRRWLGTLPAFFATVLRSLASPSPRRPVKVEHPLRMLRELIDAGVVRPVVDRTFPLEEVPAAIRYLASGDVQGKVVITVQPPASGGG